ncbi:hypothetical protein DFJ58DRAFT_810966 [Suillus subalutaceus]|uniref:uncharacterized protein n=1 Tax=Suillus subalutaceus TaxID=48586 RepID=UPI001B85F752|nr:uncharacterized protein DFJ58DRAFT_810966 [Suillus subalutaceus]KAG1840174.1 hypothetical protein DFJ58DRAFT_810966 [Suillus subalutaceus]
MVSFRLRGGARSAEALLQKLELFTLAESLGGVESLAELPARMTHASNPPAEREALGIEGLVFWWRIRGVHWMGRRMRTVGVGVDW